MADELYGGGVQLVADTKTAGGVWVARCKEAPGPPKSGPTGHYRSRAAAIISRLGPPASPAKRTKRPRSGFVQQAPRDWSDMRPPVSGCVDPSLCHLSRWWQQTGILCASQVFDCGCRNPECPSDSDAGNAAVRSHLVDHGSSEPQNLCHLSDPVEFSFRNRGHAGYHHFLRLPS